MKVRNPLQNRLFSLSAILLVGILVNACVGSNGSEPTAVASTDYLPPKIVGQIESTDIKESSGLSASECQDVLWTHNDAGSEPFIYAMDLTGKHMGAWRVENAQSIDWESISSYKRPDGKCVLYIADIGDNDEKRSNVTIYSVDEPTVSAETRNSSLASPLNAGPAQKFDFKYPEGSRNAEVVLVRPGAGLVYVLTKEKKGPSQVYRLKPDFTAGTVASAERIAAVSVPSKPVGLLTGGSFSPDGKRVMLCDVKNGYELVLPDSAADAEAIWNQTPAVVDLGERKQGEGVSYSRDGRSLYASSEKKNTPITMVQRR